ncbi:Plasmodium vivax Vir protein, putative [Plasmodium vivax]|uniref:Vir protein, putative n=1 Tax=Plasmodium vivax TaxID=5855 RepID=A0A1G4E3Y6_PLAVI|nr:Plasmodium vivax Vir protein, putative [Plasmodium vivax]SCA60453.1 Plasmodium vivax Vir protein, putative [Plasmodium vivax]
MKDLKIWSSFDDYMVIKSLGLPSEEFYKKLNHDEDTNLQAYYKVCNSIFSTKKEFVLRRPCALLFKYLVNSYKKSEKEKPAYDDCILLNYWIYGKIYEQHKDISERARSYGELQIIWNILIQDKSQAQYNKICKPDILIATQEDWKKRKELYDYFVDYDTIKGMNHFYDKYCKEIYNYLKDMDVLYKEYREHCSIAGNIMCPDFFNQYKDKDPNILLRQLTCKGVMQSEEALSVKEDKRSENSEIVPRISTDGSGLPLNSQKARDGTNPVTNSGNVLLGVVVTSMTSGALYKFTPLGRMLRNGLGFNRNNINIHDNGLFDYASGPFNPYSGGEEHYIGYHQA